jgi:hypothetical protein
MVDEWEIKQGKFKKKKVDNLEKHFVVQNMIVKRSIDERFIVLTKNTQKISNGNPLLYKIRSDLEVPKEIAKSYFMRNLVNFKFMLSKYWKKIKIKAAVTNSMPLLGNQVLRKFNQLLFWVRKYYLISSNSFSKLTN